ncbi:MAG: hypothetical protein COY39_01140 [Alphaproteobacteria bacterium CG_4_10_14_0_8_um_filter_37_21]|nr:MAG: hypothetical protein COY39_01140 [Alphaproteobacteria bacterium CG_4_10_14_0_8_um_filter_37_21]
MKKIFLTTLLTSTVAFASSNEGLAGFKPGFLNRENAAENTQEAPQAEPANIGNWTETFDTSIGRIDHTPQGLYLHFFSERCKEFVTQISSADDSSPAKFVSLHWDRTRADFVKELKRSEIFVESVEDGMAAIEAEIKAAHSSVKGEDANWTESFQTKIGIILHTPCFVNLGGFMQAGTGINMDCKALNGVDLAGPLDLKTNSTRAEFVAAMKAAGII